LWVEIKREHRFCFSCGTRLEFDNPGKNGQARIVKDPNPFSERSPEKNIHAPDRLKTLDIEDLFKKMVMAIKKECSLSDEEFEQNWVSSKNITIKIIQIMTSIGYWYRSPFILE